MNFLMTDMVDQDRRATLATFQFRDQVMLALGNPGRDGAQAQGANRIVSHRGKLAGRSSLSIVRGNDTADTSTITQTPVA